MINHGITKGSKRLAILIACLTVASAFAGCSTKGRGDSVPTLITPITEQVKTAKIQLGSIEQKTHATGNVVPVTKADMSFRNKGGNLSALNVKAGDVVKKGQVIAELDTADLKYEIKQQEIRVKQAQLTYEDAAANPNMSEVMKKKLALDLESEKLALERLQDNLSGTVLKASMAGKVIYVADVKLSQFIQGNQTLVTIADISDLQVQLEGSLAEYAIGLQAVFYTRGKTFYGEVVANNPVRVQNGQEINRVIFRFISKPEGSFIGESVDITCTTLKKDNVLLVPYKAIKFGDGNHPYLRIQEGEDIVERYVETGINDGDHVEVISGAKEGETIIIN